LAKSKAEGEHRKHAVQSRYTDDEKAKIMDKAGILSLGTFQRVATLAVIRMIAAGDIDAAQVARAEALPLVIGA
jgi:hypothetical protein